ncbi:MAG: class I lanthipeptide [Acidobacteriota bacterium]
MKKRAKKKLQLSRESLRRLQADKMAEAKGGTLCTALCTVTNSNFIECQPGYTCRQGCIPL